MSYIHSHKIPVGVPVNNKDFGVDTLVLGLLVPVFVLALFQYILNLGL